VNGCTLNRRIDTDFVAGIRERAAFDDLIVGMVIHRHALKLDAISEKCVPRTGGAPIVRNMDLLNDIAFEKILDWLVPMQRDIRW
jgi:hypothetical protein